jgi:trehalose/maltose hydrolase-like predicted phosphorylase
MRDEVLWLNPCIPENLLTNLSFRARYRSHWLKIGITQDQLTVSFSEGWAKTAQVGFGGQIYEFEQGDTKEFALQG